MPKRLLVVSDHSNSRVERSRSQVPTPNPSILSLKCSLPTASADDDRVMLVTLKAFTSMYPASRMQGHDASPNRRAPGPAILHQIAASLQGWEDFDLSH